MSDYSEYFRNFDPSYEVLYHDSWSGYEDSGWVFIFAKDGRHYIADGGFSPLSTDSGIPEFKDVVYEATPDEVLAMLDDWEDVDTGGW